MSSISSRPRVQSVSSTVVSEAATAGAVLAGGLAALVLASLTVAAREAYRAYSQRTAVPDGKLKPAASLRQEARLKERSLTTILARQGLSSMEAIQVSTLLTLQQVPFAVQSGSSLRQDFEFLSRALSPQDAVTRQRQLYRQLESEHQTMFTNALATACSNAARKAGFESIQTTSVSPEFMRVIATDPAGRTLVTEIVISKDGEPGLETEVVGVTDGSCNPLLDAFDKALEAEGVRSAPPTRRFTGGVCELAAAREFVRKKISQGQSSGIKASSSNNDIQQRRRMQQSIREKQSHKG